MPDCAIIDAHVHLYDPQAIAYPWMEAVPLLNKKHGFDEFTRAAAGLPIEGLVFVEVDAADGRHLDESRWVERHGLDNPLLKGMVGTMPLERGHAIEGDLASFAALPHARGIRRLIQDRPLGWALQPLFVDGVRLLARFGLPFDLCIRHRQLDDALALVRACPEVRFVLDHLGKPGIKDRLKEPWDSRIRQLGREPNVWCKVSGAVTEADHSAWSVDDLRPYVAHAIDCFGFDRCMFGGDWPVSRLATSYSGWVEALDDIVSGASPADIRDLYGDTARRFYGLA